MKRPAPKLTARERRLHRMRAIALFALAYTEARLRLCAARRANTRRRKSR